MIPGIGLRSVRVEVAPRIIVLSQTSKKLTPGPTNRRLNQVKKLRFGLARCQERGEETKPTATQTRAGRRIGPNPETNEKGKSEQKAIERPKPAKRERC
jgi:hypothetical protein